MEEEAQAEKRKRSRRRSKEAHSLSTLIRSSGRKRSSSKEIHGKPRFTRNSLVINPKRLGLTKTTSKSMAEEYSMGTF